MADASEGDFDEDVGGSGESGRESFCKWELQCTVSEGLEMGRREGRCTAAEFLDDLSKLLGWEVFGFIAGHGDWLAGVPCFA